MGQDALTELKNKLTEERLEEIVDEAYYEGEYFTHDTVRDAVKKAFELGKHRAPKKVNDNPYNIDYERQTKLEL